MSFVRAQFTLRRLFWVVAIIACLLGFWFVVLEPSLGTAYPASVRNRYMDGEISLEEAQSLLPRDDVSWWPQIRRARNCTEVTMGMTRDEVAKLMGEHDAGDEDRWLYRIEEYDNRNAGVTIEIVFENGRVKEVARRHITYVPSPKTEKGR